MPNRKSDSDPIRDALIHERVLLQIRIYLAAGDAAMEQALEEVEQQIEAHDRTVAALAANGRR